MPEQILHDLSNHWVRVLYGRPRTVVEVSESFVRVEGGGDGWSAPMEQANVQINRGWIFSSLEFSSPYLGAQKVSPLRHSDAEALLSSVLVLKHWDEWSSASDGFQRLLSSDGYLNESRVAEWEDRYRELFADAKRIELSSVPDAVPAEGAHRFDEIVEVREQRVRQRNDRYVREGKEKYADFFDSVEAHPLTERQREAVLRDEDALLVVAGAGTGKTTNVVAKVAFLVRHAAHDPGHVLALAFNRKAAAEMRDRVKRQVGVDMEIRTFHSLALSILQEVEKKRASVGSIAQHETERLNFVSRTLTQILDDPQHRAAYIDFVAFHRDPARYVSEFESREQYLEYMAGRELMTLQGEKVKSFEERLIADWLTLNGISYKYEFPYEVDTASLQRRQYKPDFYLHNDGIYLEHFGVDRDGGTAPWINRRKYRKGMRWKRRLHKKHDTTLVETYSYERMEGVHFEKLEGRLREHGVSMQPIGGDELHELIERPGVKDPLVALLSDFLVAFKENLYNIASIRRQGETSSDERRACAFIDLFELVYEQYEDFLRERREIDFADMIRKATRYVEDGQYSSPFRRLVVDEFQDISRGRLRFLKALLSANARSRLFAVGDDWQSIYGFTGSDVSIMREFGAAFEHHDRVDLDQTFRFNDKLLCASSRFIQAGGSHLTKDLLSQWTVDQPPVHCMLHSAGDLSKALEIIHGRNEMASADVLILGRYNFSEPENWQKALAEHQDLSGEFLTVHKAKGLEADYVIVVDLKKGKYGFPSGVRSDPLMRLILPHSAFGTPEERRLFYVALTRARSEVFLIPERGAPSPFISELLQPQYAEEVQVHGERELSSVGCPNCDSGILVRERKAKYSEPWVCEYQPYCRGAVPICSRCSAGPLLREKDHYRCQLESCAARIPRCQVCDVRLQAYVSKKHGPSAKCSQCNQIWRLHGWSESEVRRIQ